MKQKVQLRNGEIGYIIPTDPKEKGKHIVYFENNPDKIVLAYEHNLKFIKN